MKSNRKLAEAIVDRLLLAGPTGLQEAGDRLAIKKKASPPHGGRDNERDLGGWCRGAAVDQVVAVLESEGVKP